MLGLGKFTIPIPLPLLILCELSFPVVGLKTSSLPTLAMNQIYILISHTSYPSQHQFYPLSGNESSEQYHNSSPLILNDTLSLKKTQLFKFRYVSIMHKKWVLNS
jgi:hypothetical protein